MSATAKMYLDAGIKYIPQMDFAVDFEAQEGAIEASQSFLVRKKDIATGTLNNFTRGVRLEIIDPNCPSLFRNLTLKAFPIVDHAPGMMRVNATFSGYRYAGNGSSGSEKTTPTYHLQGSVEDPPLCENENWISLEDNVKWALGKFLSGDFSSNREMSAVGQWDDAHEFFTVATDDAGASLVFTDDAKKFIRMIAQNKTTFKKPSWTYTVRQQSSKGFTASQLNKLGKIVRNPPGDPQTPSSDFTWMLVGPSQDQSGNDLFYQEMNFQLIEDSDDNKFLYES